MSVGAVAVNAASITNPNDFLQFSITPVIRTSRSSPPTPGSCPGRAGHFSFLSTGSPVLMPILVRGSRLFDLQTSSTIQGRPWPPSAVPEPPSLVLGALRCSWRTRRLDPAVSKPADRLTRRASLPPLSHLPTTCREAAASPSLTRGLRPFHASRESRFIHRASREIGDMKFNKGMLPAVGLAIVATACFSTPAAGVRPRGHGGELQPDRRRPDRRFHLPQPDEQTTMSFWSWTYTA